MRFTKLFRTKPLNHPSMQTSGLHRCLSVFDLTLLGIGAIIGAGIFVLTGIAAATRAGPGVMLSYAFSGLACTFTALAYAELSSSVGGCGSAYGYAFAGLGEIMAWIIGWDLLLEYGMSCSTVAIGWSGYVHNALFTMGINIPDALMKNPFDGGIINLPASLIILLIMLLLIVGVRESAKVNMWVVLIKLTAIAIFIGVAGAHFDIHNWQPFLPFGVSGVIQGAALIFFAYIGFDAVSTAAEEAKNPERDLPISIILSLAICTLIFMVVAGLLTGVAKYTTLNVSSPVAQALINLGFHTAAGFIAVGAIAGLTTVILVMYYGFTRIFLAMSRDRLFPKSLATIHPKTQTPVRIIVFVGIIMALVAGFVPIHNLAELVNIGTLAAFTLVCLGVIVMRRTKPSMTRPFRTPWSPLIPLLGMIFCLYLMFNLPKITWVAFFIWTLLGLLVYFLYSQKRSILN
jgi:APA family basic amino acid/polyamine antiporter